LSLRLRVVKEALRGDIPLDRLSRVFGPHPNTIVNWLALYDQGGEDALVPPEPVPPPLRGRSPGAQVKHEAVVDERRQHPECGFRAS
jgi:transposase-like protein